MIPLNDMNETMKRVNKWMSIAADATRKAHEEMEAMFERNEKKPKLRLVNLDDAYNRQDTPRFPHD